MAATATISADSAERERHLPEWRRPSLRLTLLFGLLLALGAVMVASVSAGQSSTSADFARALMRRLAWTGLGLAGFCTCANIPYQRWRRHHVAIGLACVLALGAVLVPGVGTTINGARRWIRFGGLSVQPSEFAKLALIVWTAAYCERCAWTRCRRTGAPRIRTFRWGFLLPMTVVGLCSLLVLVEPDFGSAALIGLLCTSVMLVCGTRLVYVMLAGLAGAPILHRLVLDEPYRMRRILSFLGPWADPDGSGYQLIQSLIAVGSGGPWGKGLGMGVQKMGFLPAATNDFIFAIVAEELGFVGVVAVLVLFAWIMWEGLKVALRAPDTFGFALALGVTVMIGTQAALNIAVVTGTVPTKGLSLPLVSAGGSNLFVTMAAAGILVSIGRVGERPDHFKLTPWYTDTPLYQQALAQGASGMLRLIPEGRRRVGGGGTR